MLLVDWYQLAEMYGLAQLTGHLKQPRSPACLMNDELELLNLERGMRYMHTNFIPMIESEKLFVDGLTDVYRRPRLGRGVDLKTSTNKHIEKSKNSRTIQA